MSIDGVYRNLNAKKINGGLDTWSVVNSHLSADGYLVKDKGVTHSVDFSLSGIVTNNPMSIAKGCQRIKAKSREVVAIVGGTIGTTKPTGRHLGRLTLDLQAEAFLIIREDGQRMACNIAQTELWFDRNGCEVYTSEAN